jgi:hypothetical protein
MLYLFITIKYSKMKTTLKVLVFVFIGIILVQIGFVIWPIKGVLTSIIQIASSGIITLTLILTLQTYIKIKDVDKETLEFTKTQTKFNSYFDNYKLFDDLSRRKLVFERDVKYFSMPSKSDLSFENIRNVYIDLLVGYSAAELIESNRVKEYKEAFSHINLKYQSFIDAILNEIKEIKKDDSLYPSQRKTLIDLYRNFILFGYIILSSDIEVEIKNKNAKPPNLSELLHSISYTDVNLNLEFNPDNFLSLYREIK